MEWGSIASHISSLDLPGGGREGSLQALALRPCLCLGLRGRHKAPCTGKHRLSSALKIYTCYCAGSLNLLTCSFQLHTPHGAQTHDRETEVHTLHPPNPLGTPSLDSLKRRMIIHPMTTKETSGIIRLRGDASYAHGHALTSLHLAEEQKQQSRHNTKCWSRCGETGGLPRRWHEYRRVEPLWKADQQFLSR